MKVPSTSVTDPAAPFSPRQALLNLVAMAMLGGMLLSAGLLLFTLDAARGSQPWVGAIVVAVAVFVCWRSDKGYKKLLKDLSR